jgi:hypothetical protein
MRFELTTSTLARWRSTPELRPRPWVPEAQVLRKDGAYALELAEVQGGCAVLDAARRDGLQQKHDETSLPSSQPR